MKNAFIILMVILVVGVIIATGGLVLGASSSLTGANSGIFKSTDAGTNWSILPEIYKSEIETLKFGNDGRIYAGTRRNGLWISDNGGDKWDAVSTQNFGAGSRIFDLSAYSQDVVAAVFSDGRGRVLRLKDGQETELYFTPLAQYAVFGIKRHPADARVLRMISTDGGFYESEDSGLNWKSVYRFNDGLTRMIAHPTDGTRLWVVTSRGRIYGTADSGRSWSDLSGGLAKYSRTDEIETFIYDPQSGALYLGTGYGLLRSYDSGRSWQPVPLTIPPEVLPIVSVAIDPRNAAHILVTAKNQLYVSYDNGESWHGSILPTKRTASVIVIDPQNSNNIFIGLRR